MTCPQAIRKGRCGTSHAYHGRWRQGHANGTFYEHAVTYAYQDHAETGRAGAWHRLEYAEN